MSAAITRFHTSAESIPLPERFFDELLPSIDDLAELKVTLFCLWALQQKEGDYRFLRFEELLNDANLMRGICAVDAERERESALKAALDRAVRRGTLLQACVARGDERQRVYSLNDRHGQRVHQQLVDGQWTAASDNEIEILPPRPTLFRLYEENIGILTPMIVDSIKETEAEYPLEWIEAAMKIAAERNARNWRYIRKVLENWRQEGRRREEVGRYLERHKQYTAGEWKDFIES